MYVIEVVSNGNGAACQAFLISGASRVCVTADIESLLKRIQEKEPGQRDARVAPSALSATFSVKAPLFVEIPGTRH